MSPSTCVPDLITALANALRDRYTVERELGRGGMATVFLARDLKHDRPVALKVLHSELAASLGTQRFLSEIRTAARLQDHQRTGASLPEAVRYFEQATERDPNFARAYAGLADANLLLPSYASVSPGSAWPRAKAAAIRAVALDSTLAEARTSLAYGTMLYDWDWKRADELFRRAIAEDSSYATAHHWYADYLAGRGRLDEALHEMRRAAELDPLSRVIGDELGWVLYLMHRSDEALSHLETMRRLDPNFAHTYFMLGFVYLQKGESREAIASLKHALDLSGFYSQVSATLASAYASAGDTAAALRVLRDLEQRSTTQYVAPFALAMAHAGLGHKTEAFKWLHRGIQERDQYLPENFFDPLLDPLRSDARYGEVLKQMGLTPDQRGVN
jgi:tetratricopeptide (TPR) repeat protein